MLSLRTKEPPQWDSNDAKQLRELLTSDVFQKAIELVLDECPALLDGDNVNKALVASGEVRGFEKALDTLFRLTFEQPIAKPTSELYPDLDNESAWSPTNPNPHPEE